MLKKYGFTLAEVLIVLALLGILAAILLPAIAGVRPNRDKSMFRKAYYVAERLVYEIVNDDELYPTAEGTKFGLDNTNKISLNGEYFGDNDASNQDIIKQKFCKIFSRKVNTVKIRDNAGNDLVDNCVAANAKPKALVSDTKNEYDSLQTSFVTSDGVAWYLPITDFAPIVDAGGNRTPSVHSIYVDINNEKKPNCQYDADHPANCKKPDIFEIKVQSDGKMYVDGVKEKEFLEGNTNMR